MALTSVWEVETAWIEAMLYRRRLMHNPEATIPTPAPSNNFVAKKIKIKIKTRTINVMDIKKIVTDITPNRDGVKKVTRPYQTIDEFNQTS